MTTPNAVRCAIYTRKSTEEGLEQAFNSLHAQREACEAYVKSQQHEGWKALSTEYDDGGFSGGNMGRPALRKLLDDVGQGKVDTIVVYKVDRLTRSLSDFAKIVDQLDKQKVSFVSVTQQFNTTTSMGRLTLNVLLSFAQFEREVTGERIRDKIAASKKKGMWMGGVVPIGYDLQNHRLILNTDDAALVKHVFESYLTCGCVSDLQEFLTGTGVCSKRRTSKTGNVTGGVAFSRGALYGLLQNRIYLGEIAHKEQSYPGNHEPIVDRELWDKVQKQIALNRQKELGPRVQASKSMLLGRLFDSHGRAFTPSHTMRRGRRYDYYVSQIAAKGAVERIRLSATEIDGLVLSELRGLLRSPQRFITVLGNDGATQGEAIVRAVSRMPPVKDDALIAIIKSVAVLEEKVEIAVASERLRSLIFPDSPIEAVEDTGSITLSVPAKLKRSRGEVRFVLPPDHSSTKARPVPSFVKAIARAHAWAEKLASGEYPTARALAKETGFDRTYIGHLLPLAFLAPDLTESILDGRLDIDTALTDHMNKLPMDWTEQRTVFAEA